MKLPSSRLTNRSFIEALEARIAPAAIVNPGTVTFIDVDGDLVTVKITKGAISDANKDAVFTFDTAFDFAGPQQLQFIDLDAAFGGAAVTISVKAQQGGDGSVNVGGIDATGVDLKSVKIAGDLGFLNAGSGTTTAPGVLAKGVGVGSLTVDSMGRAGLASQGGAGDLFSIIVGDLGKLTVKGDVFQSGFFIAADLGAVSIGGSLIGGAVENSALIFTGANPAFAGNVGAVKIGGSIVGGAGQNTGQIFALGTIASLTVGGDVVGGTGNRSGWVYAADGMGAVTVKGSVLGNELGDVNRTHSGAITTDGALKSVTVGGDIVGGAGTQAGYIFAGGAMGAVKIGGDVRGDASVAAIQNSLLDFTASFNGGVQSATSMGNVLVGGSVIGGRGNYSGVIFVGNEDLAGPEAKPGVLGAPNPVDQPLAVPGSMGSVTIKGSVIGGGLLSTFPDGFASGASGWIKADGAMGKVTIGGDVAGSVGNYSGSIQARGAGLSANTATIASVSLGGSLRGGQGFYSGSIFVGSPDLLASIPPTATAIGAVKIGGSILGGFGPQSGALFSDTFIKSVTVGGSIVGDSSGLLTGSINSGAIISNGSLGPITVKGNIIGGGSIASGGIYAYGADGKGEIASVKIGRDLTGEVGATGIYAAGTIKSVAIGGNLVGAAPGDGTVFILSDSAILKVSVKGRVENADILAGSDFYNFAVVAVSNADAQIGSVSVGGDWIASNVAAGVDSSAAVFFGEDGLQAVAAIPAANGIASRIASITIKGNLYGTPDTAGDGFGFFAQEIGSLKIHNVAQMIPAPGGITVLGDPLSSDTVVRVFGGI